MEIRNVLEQLDNISDDARAKKQETPTEKESIALKEGIFDSKATKQKKYNQIIADNFDKKATSAIAINVATAAVNAIYDTQGNDGNNSSMKQTAANFIKAIESAKALAHKNTYGLINSIIEYCKKYARNSSNLDELMEFKKKALQVQSKVDGGSKAIAYLMEQVNNALNTKLASVINWLKKEHSIR
jgi:beta-glucosidase/6-phospho-beta-glucosidase/beta-galactosidase